MQVLNIIPRQLRLKAVRIDSSYSRETAPSWAALDPHPQQGADGIIGGWRGVTVREGYYIVRHPVAVAVLMSAAEFDREYAIVHD